MEERTREEIDAAMEQERQEQEEADYRRQKRVAVRLAIVVGLVLLLLAGTWGYQRVKAPSAASIPIGSDCTGWILRTDMQYYLSPEVRPEAGTQLGALLLCRWTDYVGRGQSIEIRITPKDGAPIVAPLERRPSEADEMALVAVGVLPELPAGYYTAEFVVGEHVLSHTFVEITP